MKSNNLVSARGSLYANEGGDNEVTTLPYHPLLNMSINHADVIIAIYNYSYSLLLVSQYPQSRQSRAESELLPGGGDINNSGLNRWVPFDGENKRPSVRFKPEMSGEEQDTLSSLMNRDESQS